MPSFSPQLFFAHLRTALLRVHKDRRARALLLRIAAALIVVAAYLVFLRFSGAPGIIGFSLGLVSIALVVWYRRRKPVEQSGPVTLDLTAHSPLEPTPEIQATPELQRELAELALLHAILAHRAASEGFLKHKGVPEGKQIVTRQNHLRILREYRMLDRLGPTERDLILAPDGAWDDDTIDRASLLLEPVRVFRWLLRLDPLLPLVGEAKLIDFQLAATLLDQPERLFELRGVVEMEHLRTARAGAERIFYRCYSEAHRRGFLLATNAENAQEAIFYAERLVGQESEDLLLGNIIVSRASDEEVRLAASVALRRIQLLRWVQERLYGTLPAAPTLTAVGWS